MPSLRRPNTLRLQLDFEPRTSKRSLFHMSQRHVGTHKRRHAEYVDFTWFGFDVIVERTQSQGEEYSRISIVWALSTVSLRQKSKPWFPSLVSWRLAQVSFARITCCWVLAAVLEMYPDGVGILQDVTGEQRSSLSRIFKRPILIR